MGAGPRKIYQAGEKIFLSKKLNETVIQRALVKLVEHDLKKTEFAKMAGISTASIAKLGKGANVKTDVLLKICETLDCDISYIVEVVKDDDQVDKNRKL